MVISEGLLKGEGAILRGDLRRSTAGQHVVISMGRYCSVGERAIIRPPGKIYKGYVERITNCFGADSREGSSRSTQSAYPISSISARTQL